MRKHIVAVVRVLGAILLAVLAIGSVSRSTVAGEPSCWHWFAPPYTGCPCPCCPDDYCAKPLPCMTPLKCCGPNDYCCKPLPCMTPLKYCGPNDYCCKPYPVMLPLCTSSFTCGPPPCGCEDANSHSAHAGR
jgi:hypothetical protein